MNGTCNIKDRCVTVQQRSDEIKDGVGVALHLPRRADTRVP